MCGKEGRIVVAEIEGGELNVCSNCAKYGTIKKKEFVKRPHFQQKTAQRPADDFKIVDDFALLLKKARSEKEMTQEEFSKFLNEKESIVAKWESGIMKPRINVARRIGRVLKMNFVIREQSEAKVVSQKKVSDEFTLGDFIKVRKRKT